jgi:hypothetical protein
MQRDARRGQRIQAQALVTGPLNMAFRGWSPAHTVWDLKKKLLKARGFDVKAFNVDLGGALDALYKCVKSCEDLRAMGIALDERGMSVLRERANLVQTRLNCYKKLFEGLRSGRYKITRGLDEVEDAATMLEEIATLASSGYRRDAFGHAGSGGTAQFGITITCVV